MHESDPRRSMMVPDDFSEIIKTSGFSSLLVKNDLGTSHAKISEASRILLDLEESVSHFPYPFRRSAQSWSRIIFVHT